MEMETTMGSRSLSLGDIAEAGAGGFAGLLTGNLPFFLPIGQTIRARVAFGSLISIGGGALLGWLISKARKPLGAGFAAGTVGMGFLGLLAILVGPANVLDAPAEVKSFSPVSFSGMVSSGMSTRKSARRLRNG